MQRKISSKPTGLRINAAFCHPGHRVPVCPKHSARRSHKQCIQPNALQPTSCCFEYGSPLGLSRPVDCNMESKILRGEYVDLALLLHVPDNMYQSQAPEIQLHLDDSSSGLMGSPVAMVRKRKPIIDSFQKWPEAYMVYRQNVIFAVLRVLSRLLQMCTMR